MRLWIWLCVLLLASPLAAEPWYVVGDDQFAPYSFLAADDDTPRGLDVELVAAVMREAGQDYRLRLYPWARVKQMLERREVKMAFQFAGTPERRGQYELVGPLRTGRTVFMVNRSVALEDWKTLTNFEPYVIGQVRGYAYEEAFDKADLRRDSSASNPRQLVSMLLAGRIAVIVGDRDQLLYFAREQRAEAQVRVLPTPLVEMPRYVAFAKGDTAPAQQFSEALERLRQRGALEEILRRWR